MTSHLPVILHKSTSHIAYQDKWISHWLQSRLSCHIAVQFRPQWLGCAIFTSYHSQSFGLNCSVYTSPQGSSSIQVFSGNFSHLPSMTMESMQFRPQWLGYVIITSYHSHSFGFHCVVRNAAMENSHVFCYMYVYIVSCFYCIVVVFFSHQRLPYTTARQMLLT